MNNNGSLRISNITLRVIDLEHLIRFYVETIGFKHFKKEGSVAFLGIEGTDDPLIVLEGDPHTQPKPRRAPGLFHLAVLLEERKDLSQLVKSIIERGAAFTGAADHGVSEAFYLEDPEGNGIELYRDRPRSEWPFSRGVLQMGTNPLDVNDLLAESDHAEKSWVGLRTGTRIGHLHLQVSELRQSERFYNDILGLDVMQRSFPGALFLSRGGYHHHLGLNIWNSRGTGPLPAGAAGLTSFTFSFSAAEHVQHIRDRVSSQMASPTIANMTANAGVDFTIEDPDRINVKIASVNLHN